MSWIVQSLLLDKYPIKERIYKRDGISNSYSLNFNSDEYNSLLLIERKMDDLLNSGAISEKGIEITELLSLGKTYAYIADELKISKNSIKKKFRGVCDKIAFSLGGEFTDYGYIDYMIRKHNLKGKEIDKLVELITKRKRI